MEKNNRNKYIPIIISISIVFGIIIGYYYTGYNSRSNFSFIGKSQNKIDALLRIIDQQYVDSININDVTEDVIPEILAELDPHSLYIPAKQQEDANEKIEGSFSGIGIQFTINKDTIYVMRVIPGGPSEKVGLMAGDRIIAVDDSSFVGKIVNDENAIKKLKGPKGSNVKITAFRPSINKNLDFTVQRGDIPINSVDACYMITDKIGYIKINTFSLSTYEEMLSGIAELKYNKCKGIIIDLRDNLGGVMEIAIKMVNEFLPENKLIVYTEGRKSPKQEYYSDGHGTCKNIPIVVLINEASASASEIFSGAIQDNDRGLIVGRRSFGKGLVQQPIDFKDGSSVRLTIARYYTPSGRSIQRQYEKGKNTEYELDILKRYEHGEFFSQDSMQVDSLKKYKTSIGRTVYGGGGIVPDFFIPQDTTGYTSYLGLVNQSGLISKYAFEYTDKNRNKFENMQNYKELISYLDRRNMVEDFVRFAEKNGIKRRNLQINKSYKLLKQFIYAGIIYDVYDIEEYIEFLNQNDKAVDKAIELINDYDANPAKLPK